MGNKIVLKVSEAIRKDIGKGMIRIPFSLTVDMGASIGDLVLVQGKKTAIARLMPHIEQTEMHKASMDGLLRENAGVGLDDTVTLEIIPKREAEKVVLKSIYKKESRIEQPDIKFYKEALLSIPMLEGNRVRVRPFGYAHEDYIVHEIFPKDANMLGNSSKLVFQNTQSSHKEQKISYEDIGGLSKQIQRVREMIELPLRFPEVFSKLGIEPPKGVLLFGPPGTGKTLIARAVANETDAHFLHVNGPEIIHKYYGESEARLREIFEKASQNAPSIIFLDEIDAIACKREEVKGEVEKRVVAQLLTLMDGLKSRGQVIVIGATNIPNALDPALRRPGRFDRELEIGIPDYQDRIHILQIHSSDMPLHENVDIEKLAELTHGYVGADLQSLCREAAMTALRGIFPYIDFNTSSIPYEKVTSLCVTMEDFEKALNEIEPSALRDVVVEIPKVSFDEIGGLQKAKEQLYKQILWPYQYGKEYATFGCKPPKGILFYGEPGTGKTMIAKALASTQQYNFIYIKGPEVISKWVGEAERTIREIFKKARQSSPCVIFFDELDSIFPVRGQNGDSNSTEKLLCQVLTEIDGLQELKEVLVIGATNRKDRIDPALLRPGRLGLHIYFPRPMEEERVEILRIHLKDKPPIQGISLEELSEMTEGASGADIMALCQNAAIEALEEYIVSKENGVEVKPYLGREHFDKAWKGI